MPQGSGLVGVVDPSFSCRDSGEQADLAGQILSGARFNKLCKKQNRDPKKILDLLHERKKLMKGVKRIDKALRKLGYDPKKALRSSSSESDEELTGHGLHYIQQASKMPRLSQ